MAELVYVSWGGTGRGAALRAAFVEAAEKGRDLVYLGILDARTFEGVDDVLAGAMADELDWLLRAQIRMIKSELGIDGIEARVVVRRGDVEEEIAAFVRDTGAEEVLVGAPVIVPRTVQRAEGLDDLVGDLTRDTGVDVSVIGPEQFKQSE